VVATVIGTAIVIGRR